MKREAYVKAVLQKLNCSKTKKKSIQRDLEADIAIAMESGETWEQIRERLGSPKALAEEMNDNMGVSTPRRSGLKTAGIVIGVVLLILAIGIGYVYWLLPKNYPMGTLGVFSQEEIQDKCIQVIQILNAEDYDLFTQEYCSQPLRDVMGGSEGVAGTLQEVKDLLGGEFGEYMGIGSEYYVETKSSGNVRAGAEIVAIYQNKTVTYTLIFDSDRKLIGIHMK